MEKATWKIVLFSKDNDIDKIELEDIVQSISEIDQVSIPIVISDSADEEWHAYKRKVIRSGGIAKEGFIKGHRLRYLKSICYDQAGTEGVANYSCDDLNMDYYVDRSTLMVFNQFKDWEAFNQERV